MVQSRKIYKLTLYLYDHWKLFKVGVSEAKMLNLIHKYMNEGKLEFSSWVGCIDQNIFCRHSKRRVIESLVAQRLTRSRRVMG